MTELLHFVYVSPISDINFDNNNYYLVITNLRSKNQAGVYVILLKDLNNIDDNIRAYVINKTICDIISPYLSIKIFKKTNNKLILLFTHLLNIDNIEYNNKNVITLYQPVTLLYTNYINNSSFLEEQFYNIENINKDNKCVLFFMKYKHINKEKILKPNIVTLTNYIYNRYNDILVTQKQNKIAFIDKTLYENNDITFFNKATIKSQYRNKKHDQYINSAIIASNDGTYNGFVTKKFKNFYVDLTNDIINGSGYISRIRQYDYKRICIPYGGYLKNINKINNKIIIKIHNPYYVPADVHEREYISVFLGHRIYSSRIYPELVDIQDKIGLVYYLIILCNDFVFINNKLFNNNTNVWLENSENLGYVNSTDCSVIFLSNRRILFTNDIEYYSNYDVDSYIKQRDMIGILL